MALVDYSSSSSGSDPDSSAAAPPPAKKPRIPTEENGHGPFPRAKSSPAGVSGSPGPPPSSSTPLPPLPATFHDLYASTVRTATTDAPSLHQNRRRQTPHIPGHWPSHLYIEYHPPPPVSSLLAGLVSSLAAEAAVNAIDEAGGEGKKIEISSFLQNDLSVPLPLHVSLSRPLSLTTQQKDGFLSDISAALSGSGPRPFVLKCTRAEWHRTHESGRSFLVLRVSSSSSEGGLDDGDNNENKELTELLARCNAVCKKYRQPELYSWALSDRDRVVDAFHVSIAWSFAEPTEELVTMTKRVFGDENVARELRETIRIPVGGVKAKIGNLVTHIPLPQPGKRKQGDKPNGAGGGNLLGL